MARKRRKKPLDILRDQLETSIWHQVLKLALNRYRWDGLPEGCNERYLEYTLLNEGMATIAMYEEGDWINAQVIQQGIPDLYHNPVAWRAFGLGVDFGVTPDNGVIIWENRTRTNLRPYLDALIREIVDLLEVKQVNRFQSKIPYIIKGEKQRTGELDQLVKRIHNNQLAMITTDISGLDNVEVLTTGVPFIADQLNEDISYYWDMIYQALGIRNVPYKAERMLNNELDNMEGVTEVYLNDGIMARQEAADYLNKTFGMEITVVQSRDTQSKPWYDEEMGLNDPQINPQLNPQGGQNEPPGT